VRITIIGAGAIGSICGVYLTKAGRAVTLVEPWREHLERIKKGAYIDGVRGEMTVPLNAIMPGEVKEPLELVLLAVKSGKTLEALENIRPFIHADTVVVSLQNGFNVDMIASAIGREHVVGCVIGWGATSVGPGHLTQTSEGRFVVGELDGKLSDRLGMVKDILSDISEVTLTQSIYGHLWSKLSINCLIAGCGVLGLNVGEALAPERNKRVFIQLVREVMNVATACGVRPEMVEGVVDPLIFTRTDTEGLDTCFRILDMMAAVHGSIKPGPLQDIEKGWESEVDYITGYCVKKGLEIETPTPINEKVHALIKGMEAKRVIPRPENIGLLEAAAKG